MKAYGKNILFKPFPPSDVTEGGLVVPDSAKTVNNKGIIVSVGEMVTKVKEGQVGFRVKEWGTEIGIGGESYYLMDETAILATA